MVIMVSNLIPQNLDLKEEVQLQGCYEGVEYLLELTQFFGSTLYLPKTRIAGHVAQLDMSSIISADGDKTTAYRTVSTVDDCRCPQIELQFRDDSIGTIDYYAQDGGYVHARVIFDDLKVRSKGSAQEKIGEYVDFASAVIANYLLALRYLSNANILKPYSKDLSPANRIYAAVDDPGAKLFDFPSLECISDHINLPKQDDVEPYFIRMRDYGVGDFLYSGRAVPIADQLLLEAKNLAFNARSYDAAIVLIQSSFELYVTLKMKTDCESADIRKLKTAEDSEMVNYRKAIERASVSKLLGFIAEQIYGEALNSGKEYEEWRCMCYKKRNCIAHRGCLNSNLRDVRNAFEAMSRYREHLDSRIPKVVEK